MINIKEDWCKGCLLCIKRCPVDALEESDVLNKRGVYPPREIEGRCTNCRLCELICPDFAITVLKDDDYKPKERGKLIIGGITDEI